VGNTCSLLHNLLINLKPPKSNVLFSYTLEWFLSYFVVFWPQEGKCLLSKCPERGARHGAIGEECVVTVGRKKEQYNAVIVARRE